MAGAKYEKILTEQDANGEADDIDEYDVSIATRSISDIGDNSPLTYGCQQQKLQSSSAHSIMQTPYAIVALILIYFGFSISLTFYQRNLLKVGISMLINVLDLSQIIYLFSYSS